MTHDEDDPITPQRLDAAAHLLVQRCRSDGSVPGDAAAEIVSAQFDALVPGGDAAVLARLVVEVSERARIMLAEDRAVDRTSLDSFPASDPPAWIGGRPTR